MNALFVVLSFLLFPSFFSSPCEFGELSQTTPVQFSDLITHPEQYVGKKISFIKRVRIAALDTLSGSWIQIRDPSTESPVTIFVKSDSKFFTFPIDVDRELELDVQGYFNMFEFNNEQLIAPLQTFEINATAVKIYNKNGTCEKFLNEIVVKDLSTGSLDGPSIGAGHVCLKPGGIMPQHSTQHSYEVVNSIKNCVYLRINRGGSWEEHELCEGTSALIPFGTPHMVINKSHEDEGCYIYVHAVVDLMFGH